MADRIVVLDEGRIEQLSPTQHLYSSPDTSFVADFVGNTNMYDGEVVEAADGSCIVRLDGGLTMMCEHNGFDVGDNVRIALRQEQVSIADEQREIDNLYEGRIVDTTFRGDLISYSVSIDGLSAPIEVSELNDMNHRVYSAGDTIAVGWNATEVYLYAR